MLFLVYGGTSYAPPTDLDSEWGVDKFASLDEALQEFHFRKVHGRTTTGLGCPVWDDEESGGVLEIDGRGDAVGLYR